MVERAFAPGAIMTAVRPLGVRRGCSRSRRCDADPQAGSGAGRGPSFDPRAYTPEDPAVIEAALKLMLAGRSAPAERGLIPPGDD
jgi:hypothetical protein